MFQQLGSADLDLAISRSAGTNELDISANINDWNINGQQLGQFDLNAIGNTLMNTYLVSFNLESDILISSM